MQDYTITLCASPSYLARRGTPTKPEDLQLHDCLAFAYPSTDDWRNADKLWRMTGADGEVEIPVSGSLTINSSQALRQAAVQGMGIVMLPDALVQPDLHSDNLVALLTDYQLPSRPMHVLYGQDRYRLPKLRAFVDFVMEKWAR
jgi:DNA-binding transcriptional LysR family regulator